MNIRIHRGENQIGGNIIEIATEETRILLDAGLELDEPEPHVLPSVDGLFDRAGFDAVFISHYHIDHLGLVYDMDRGIPVYLGEQSYRMVRATDAFRHKDTFSPAGFLRHKEPIIVGDITITPFLCDHSAFDSYMLLCQAQGETVLYTGDFRANGRKSFDRLLEALPDHVDTLICEGTTLSRPQYEAKTESQLEQEAVRLFREHSGPVFVLQASTNIDRMVTMYRAAKRSGRVFLQEVYMAQVASAAGRSIPNPDFDDVFAFLTTPSRYEALKQYEHRMGKAQIAKEQFVMCVRSSMLSYLQSLRQLMSFDDGILVYSMWSGYREQPQMQQFLEGCRQLGLRTASLHTGGHADAAAIRRLIERVTPTRILPIHTLLPQWFDQT